MYKLSEAEWSVLQTLWDSSPMLLGQITDRLKPVHQWSRNTVHTYLSRMERKGLVVIDRETEPHRYTAAVTREECARMERQVLLDRVYGGAAGDLIAAFLKDAPISAQERERLRRLLDQMEV